MHVCPAWSLPSAPRGGYILRVGSFVQVATFDMVEDFWGIFNNIRPPSRLNPGSNYHLFKVGIEPMWEHPANMNGGKWTYR